MDREQVIKQLRGWVDGVDPVTGETLPADHPAHRADVLRVLYGALELLDTPAPPRGSGAAHVEQRAPFPRNAGRPWSADDDRALADAFEAGASVGAIAKTFERTRGSITARLVKLGKMAPDPSMRLRGPVTAPAGAEV